MTSACHNCIYFVTTQVFDHRPNYWCALAMTTIRRRGYPKYPAQTPPKTN